MFHIIRAAVGCAAVVVSCQQTTAAWAKVKRMKQGTLLKDQEICLSQFLISHEKYARDNFVRPSYVILWFWIYIQIIYYWGGSATATNISPFWFMSNWKIKIRMSINHFASKSIRLVNETKAAWITLQKWEAKIVI